MRKQVTIPYYNLSEAKELLQRVENTTGKNEPVQLRLLRRTHTGETPQDSQEVLYKHARALNAFCRRRGNRAHITMVQEVAQKKQKQSIKTLSVA